MANTNPKDVMEKAKALEVVKVLEYPSDVTLEGKYTFISVLKYQKEKVFSPEKSKIIHNFVLPLPLEMSHADSLGYNDTGGLIENLLGDASFKDKLASAVLSVAKNIAGGDSDTLKRDFLNGVQVNPQAGVYFNAPQLKIHTFRYNFIARNREETEQITKIINRFRYYAHPFVDPNNTTLFDHPELFKIKFLPDVHLYEPNLCVLTEVAVNYNDQSNGMFFRESFAPVDVSLQLTFKEIAVETKQTLENKHLDLIIDI